MHPPPPETPPAERTSHSYVVTRHSVQWDRPIFRAPALTNWPQLAHNLPVAPVFPAKTFHATPR